MATQKNLTGEEQSLRLVVEGTVAETGTEIFCALAKNLATVMGTAGAWGRKYLPETRQVRSHTKCECTHDLRYERTLKEIHAEPIRGSPHESGLQQARDR